jgi:type I restriction enzyme S subunit
MSFPRYGEYKDSGVEWLGEVPGHWSVLALKRLATIQYGIGEPPKYQENGTPLIRATNVNAGCITNEGLVFVDPNDIPSQRIVWLSPGDIIVVRSGAYTGDSAIIREEHCPCIAGFDMVVHPSGCLPDFLQYALLAQYLKDNQIDLEKLRAAQPHLNAEELGQCFILVPPSGEQSAIAAFLDRQTAKIDALVAEQEKLIALLAEKRQAVISHAVTKGLNPTAPLKDSGIEWLGDVPEHWRVVPMKYLVTLQSGGTPSKENEAYWEGTLPWASAKDMKVEFLADTEDHITEYAVERGAASLLDAGVVLVVVRGMILARTFPVALTRAPMAINQDLKAVITGADLKSEFAAWYFRGTAEESLHRLDEAGHGTKALRMDAWTSLEIALPSLPEQSAIAAFLDAETARLDTLTTEARRAIDLLKEHRSAQISAAVTGKIDVRRLIDEVAA